MSQWPAIPYPRFEATNNTLHMWAQIVGKFRLANTPWVNHSWHATLYPTARGLTTGPVPVARGVLEVTFDFVTHRLRLETSDGREDSFALEAMSVADFHRKFQGALAALDAPTAFHHAPNEVPDPVPFAKQTELGHYDPDAARDFWQALLSIADVFARFRTGFLGKVSPVHLFWGSFDLAVTRFSGRTAPRHPGGIPALPDAITWEAYSHEVSSAGFWPGAGLGEPAFYSYAYPTPDGFSEAAVQPAAARFDTALGEFLLPYEAVRLSADPEGDLLAFLHSTYNAAADLAAWDRATLDCAEGELGRPRSV